MQTREEIEQREPAAQKNLLLGSAQLAAIESSDFLKSGRSLGLRLRNQIAKYRRGRLCVFPDPPLPRKVRSKKRAYFQTDCLTHKRWHGVSNDPELMRARHRKPKPIGKA